MIERIRADHPGLMGAIEYDLGEGKQCFVRTVDGQHLTLRIGRRHTEAPADPFGDRLAQSRAADRGWVHRQTIQVGADRLADERRCPVAWLAN